MKKQILLIEDDEIVRTGIEEDLSREAYDVIAVDNVGDAENVLASRRIDLVLSDIVLGERDGMELLRHMRTNFPDIPVVMMTAYGSMETVIEALRLGANDYLQKPVSSVELLHRIRTVLTGVQLRRDMESQRVESDIRKQEYAEQLARAERMASIGSLADGMAYELNNALSPVVSYPRLILEQLDPDDAILPYIEEIAMAGQNAVAIIRDLQAIGTGGRHRMRPMDLNETIRRYIDFPEHQRLVNSHPDVQLNLELGAGKLQVEGSENQVDRILVNLLEHAYNSFDDKGTVTIKTELQRSIRPSGLFETGPKGDYVILSVAHDGRWMGTEKYEKIFEPFYTMRELHIADMNGLGLTLVYRVVKNHRGYLRVSSLPEKGTTFWIYFPLLEVQEIQKRDPLMAYSGNENVLVVDDYEQQRRVAASLLRRLGYTVITASSGYEAVDAVKASMEDGAQKLDLVVMDMILGDSYDGLDAYKDIIEIVPGMKSVLVSGFAETSRIVEAKKVGKNKFVQKPYSFETLGKAVWELLHAPSK